MKKLFSFCAVLLILGSFSPAAPLQAAKPQSGAAFVFAEPLLPLSAVSRGGYFKGIRLAGKVKVVDCFADIKVQVVNNFPDLKVKVVEHFPDRIGEWKFVDSFPDFTIQYVNSFPDIKIQFVNSFPGVK